MVIIISSSSPSILRLSLNLYFAEWCVYSTTIKRSLVRSIKLELNFSPNETCFFWFHNATPLSSFFFLFLDRDNQTHHEHRLLFCGVDAVYKCVCTSEEKEKRSDQKRKEKNTKRAPMSISKKIIDCPLQIHYQTIRFVKISIPLDVFSLYEDNRRLDPQFPIYRKRVRTSSRPIRLVDVVQMTGSITLLTDHFFFFLFFSFSPTHQQQRHPTSISTNQRSLPTICTYTYFFNICVFVVSIDDYYIDIIFL